MRTAAVEHPLSSRAANPASLAATGLGLTSVLVGLFVLCYAVSFIWPLSSLAHGWVRLFATDPQNIARSLLEGIVGSVGAAWFSALLFVPVYNKFLKG